MQNLPNMPNVKRCSKCTKTQDIYNFGFKKNGDEFKTCCRCRKKPPVISLDVINKPIVNTDVNIKDPKVLINNEYYPQTIHKIKDIFKDYGFVIMPITQATMNNLFDAMDNEYIAEQFIDFMNSNKLVALKQIKEAVNVLFSPDNKTVYHMNVKNTNLIDNYTKQIKFKSKKRCGICDEKNKKYYNICSRCDNKYCNSCFTKVNDNCLRCPFCRYTLKDHIQSNIVKFNEDPIKLFNYILETS